MNLSQGEIGKEYEIVDITLDDEEVKEFLFTLGCFSGEKITIIDHQRQNLVVSIKDARYNIDLELANFILVH